MCAALNTTFRFLSRTENEAAVDVLIAGLDDPHEPTRHGALQALMQRRSPKGHREVFRRLPAMGDASRAIVNERPERLEQVVGAAIKLPDETACSAACQAVVATRLYSVLPALVQILSNPENANGPRVAQTVLVLTEAFYVELSGGGNQPLRRNMDSLRQRITVALEEAVRGYHRHQRKEVVEALLLVAKSKSVTLRRLLQRTDEASHQTIIDLMSKSSRGGVIRFLLGFLEEPKMPRVVTEVIGRRCDPKFVGHLAKTVGLHPTKLVIETLKRFDSIAWAEPGHKIFRQLDEEAQAGAVQLLAHSAVDREQALAVIGDLLLNGKPAGRRSAAKAMEQFEGPEACGWVIRAVNDEDSEVRARLIVQLRPRKIPGAMSLLIRMVEDTDDLVREALRKAMPEFTFRQFLSNFDKMPEDLQPIAGHVVSKTDPECVSKLADEMLGPSPVRRRRAVQASLSMGISTELQETIIKLLSDEDHIVRVAAAQALADCKSLPTWEALLTALLDRSVVVKEAAERSLEMISQSLAVPVEDEQADEQSVEPEEVVS